jgi:uncharacterized protein (UPF0297 family)
MKIVLTLIALLISTDAFAMRYGRDERIYACTSGPEAELVGPNEKFSVHIVEFEDLTITRLSDGKFLTFAFKNSIYDIPENRDHGDLWPADNDDGYLYNDLKKTGHLLITRNKATKYTRVDCVEEKVISEYSPLTPTEEAMIKIGDEANLGNGGYDFLRFDAKTFDLEKEKKALVAEFDGRWAGCTWEMIEGYDNIIKEIKTTAYDSLAARRVNALNKKVGFIGAIAYVSDRDVSCSNTIVWLYTKDGIKLDLTYSQGD